MKNNHEWDAYDEFQAQKAEAQIDRLLTSEKLFVTLANAAIFLGGIVAVLAGMPS